MTRKPILAIAPRTGDTAQILLRSGLGIIVEHGDSESIRQILRKLCHEKSENRLAGELNEDFLSQFETRTLTRKLSFVLNDVLARNP